MTHSDDLDKLREDSVVDCEIFDCVGCIWEDKEEYNGPCQACKRNDKKQDFYQPRE